LSWFIAVGTGLGTWGGALLAPLVGICYCLAVNADLQCRTRRLAELTAAACWAIHVIACRGRAWASRYDPVRVGLCAETSCAAASAVGLQLILEPIAGRDRPGWAADFIWRPAGGGVGFTLQGGAQEKRHCSTRPQSILSTGGGIRRPRRLAVFLSETLEPAAALWLLP